MKAKLNVLAAVTVLTLAGFGRFATAAEDVEARLRALERRVERLEREVEEKDAVIERLRERLDRRDAAPGGQPLPPPAVPPGVRPGLPFNWPPDQFGDLQDRVRKEIERWGLEWGLPGREARPGTRPREIVPFGNRRRAFLGIEMENAPAGGVSIRKVVPGSPAEKAGLAAGDELVAIDGHPVATPQEVAVIVGAHEPGDEIQLRLRRDGVTLTVKAKLVAPEADRLLPMPRWRIGPARPGRRGRPGRDREKGPDAEKRGDSIEVEVTVPGGRAKVTLSAPGLFLSEKLARELDLTEAERREVEDAFAHARDKLGRSLSVAVARGGGNVDGGIVREKRLEAEKEARVILARRLPEEKVRAIERAQAKVASQSRISISVRRGTERRHGGPRREPEPMPPDELQEF